MCKIPMAWSEALRAKCSHNSRFVSCPSSYPFKEPTVPRCDPPFNGLSFAEQTEEPSVVSLGFGSGFGFCFCTCVFFVQGGNGGEGGGGEGGEEVEGTDENAEEAEAEKEEEEEKEEGPREPRFPFLCRVSQRDGLAFVHVLFPMKGNLGSLGPSSSQDLVCFAKDTPSKGGLLRETVGSLALALGLGSKGGSGTHSHHSFDTSVSISLISSLFRFVCIRSLSFSRSSNHVRTNVNAVSDEFWANAK